MLIRRSRLADFTADTIMKGVETLALSTAFGRTATVEFLAQKKSALVGDTSPLRLTINSLSERLSFVNGVVGLLAEQLDGYNDEALQKVNAVALALVQNIDTLTTIADDCTDRFASLTDYVNGSPSERARLEADGVVRPTPGPAPILTSCARAVESMEENVADQLATARLTIKQVESAIVKKGLVL